MAPPMRAPRPLFFETPAPMAAPATPPSTPPPTARSPGLSDAHPATDIATAPAKTVIRIFFIDRSPFARLPLSNDSVAIVANVFHRFILTMPGDCQPLLSI